MEYRQGGRAGLEVSALGFGGNQPGSQEMSFDDEPTLMRMLGRS